MATIESAETDASRAHRYHLAAVLLHKWQTEDSEYDELVGTILDRELANDVMQCRVDDESTA